MVLMLGTNIVGYLDFFQSGTLWVDYLELIFSCNKNTFLQSGSDVVLKQTCNFYKNFLLNFTFYTPVLKKRDVLWYGACRLSIRSSGRPSVTILSGQLLLYYWMEFLQTCMDGCLWCLVVHKGEITLIALFVLELFPFVIFWLKFLSGQLLLEYWMEFL